jgi:hypothetical protein
VNLPLLFKEKSFINHQFPMVTPLADPPTLYEGLVRCEKGEVKDLAEKGVWPFTEYIGWHRFRLELLNESVETSCCHLADRHIPSEYCSEHCRGRMCICTGRGLASGPEGCFSYQLSVLSSVRPESKQCFRSSKLHRICKSLQKIWFSKERDAEETCGTRRHTKIQHHPVASCKSSTARRSSNFPGAK